jgi:hypothetical protein
VLLVGVRGREKRGEGREFDRRLSAMFFHINLDKNIILEARHFGKNMREVLHEKLKNEVSGSAAPFDCICPIAKK